jgi:putative PIN family toxin of toxin-antitoxin system
MSALLAQDSQPAQVVRLFEQKRYMLVVSSPLHIEWKTVLLRPQWQKYGISQSLATEFYTWLITLPHFLVEPTHSALIVRDPKDQHILECALTGAADYLVTGDKDLLVLKENLGLGKLVIVTPSEFLNEVAG